MCLLGIISKHTPLRLNLTGGNLHGNQNMHDVTMGISYKRTFAFVFTPRYMHRHCLVRDGGHRRQKFPFGPQRSPAALLACRVRLKLKTSLWLMGEGWCALRFNLQLLSCGSIPKNFNHPADFKMSNSVATAIAALLSSWILRLNLSGGSGFDWTDFTNRIPLDSALSLALSFTSDHFSLSAFRKHSRFAL